MIAGSCVKTKKKTKPKLVVFVLYNACNEQPNRNRIVTSQIRILVCSSHNCAKANQDEPKLWFLAHEQANCENMHKLR